MGSALFSLKINGLRSLVPPTTVETVILCPDGDPPGAQAAAAAAARFAREGRQVKIAPTPRGADLDVLLGQV